MDDLQGLLFPIYTRYVKYYFVPIGFSPHVRSTIVISLLPEAFFTSFPPEKTGFTQDAEYNYSDV